MARHFEAESTVPFPEVVSIRSGRIEAVGEGRALSVALERKHIGRAPQCALVLDDSTVSALHVEVQAAPGGVRLLDLGSRNGTFLGETRIVEVYLNGPCEFRCGKRLLRFLLEPALDQVLDGETRFGRLIGTTSEMRALFDALRRFSDSNLSIVITGETGTGKEVVARAIHEASARRGRPFLAVNCAAMTDALLEDELFGHVKGAFTGADRDRNGMFVEAHAGTLFFDEVAEMSAAMQVKLLRALEHGEVRPVGTERARKVNVRTLFATHADLEEAVNRGTFREDLYFRIAQMSVQVPPLRRRLEDIPLLVRQILDELGHSSTAVDEAALPMLMARTWPGNVRELRSLIEVALVSSEARLLSFNDALRVVHRRPLASLESVIAALAYSEAKAEFKRRYYTALYGACRGNVTQIAKRAGMQRKSVREALRSIGLDFAPEDVEDRGGG
jgi:DNA-binding NtrC family response regulator